MSSENGVQLVKTISMSGVKFGIEIPEWLLVEMLIRLPVKQVFKVKVVCKRWLSMISDPYFIRMYVSRASMLPRSQIWTFISANMRVSFPQFWDPVNELIDDVYSRLLEDVDSQDPKFPNLYVANCPFPEHPWCKMYKIDDVSDGLALYVPFLHREDSLSYNICNPITRQMIALPLHGQRFKSVCRGFVTRVENGILTSYRVVRLEFPLKRSNLIRFEVFISEIGSWKDFTICTDQTINVLWYCMPAVLNGILHWITRKHGIIAYDPYLKPDCLRYIPLPSDEDLKCNEGKHITNLCDVREGRLRYFKIFDVDMPPHGFSSFGVWVLNDYNTGEWCLQHRISSANILFSDHLSGKFLNLKPLSFHPFEPEIVYLIYRKAIVSYNMKTRKLEHHRDPPNERLLSWGLSFPFVIPPWPASIRVPQG